MPVDCNIHPWMRAYVVVLDHPLAGVSDLESKLTIEGLPKDESLTFRVFHEAGRIDRVTMSGTETEWKRSRFSVVLTAGEKDLGDILIPATSLNRRSILDVG
jgi:hypothetical protein